MFMFPGGFKVWECAIDLCEYIDKALEPQVLRDKKILEVAYQFGTFRRHICHFIFIFCN